MAPSHFTHPISRKKLLECISIYQVSPQKKLGQNFLVDPNIISIIVKSLDLNREESIFEIGTGLGSLTLALITSTKHVFTMEKDRTLKPILENIFEQYQESVTILYQDFLAFDLEGFLAKKAREGDIIEKIAGNLPYSISLPLLRKLMERDGSLKIAVVMVQKEVAERLLAQPGEKKYGTLSVVSRYYSSIEKIHRVKADVFFPKPEVDSMILRIKFFDKSIVQVEDEKLFFQVIRAVFQHRRKTLSNALKLYFGESLDKDNLIRCLQKMGLAETQRGENFDLREFARLTGEIKKIIK